jgi:hypothetical protein
MRYVWIGVTNDGGASKLGYCFICHILRYHNKMMGISGYVITRSLGIDQGAGSSQKPMDQQRRLVHIYTVYTICRHGSPSKMVRSKRARWQMQNWHLLTSLWRIGRVGELVNSMWIGEFHDPTDLSWNFQTVYTYIYTYVYIYIHIYICIYIYIYVYIYIYSYVYIYIYVYLYDHPDVPQVMFQMWGWASVYSICTDGSKYFQGTYIRRNPPEGGSRVDR